MNSIIKRVREFNRFYTNILGLLDKHILDSHYSLSEVRVLYEIANMEKCTAKLLNEELAVDLGYLSRIIKRFEKDDLINRVKSENDGRIYYLFLTDKGKDIMKKLDQLSCRYIEHMIKPLKMDQQEKLIKSMNTIENILSVREDTINGKKKVNIRCDLKPGDVGYLIYLHGWIYEKECGYNYLFEGYVCKTFYDFYNKYNPNKDQFWLAEFNGEIIGSIAIVGHTQTKAQLRWFILHPDYRGYGLGKSLLNEAMAYCKNKGYQNVFLETTQDQEKAIKMYEQFGFEKVSVHEHHAWGKDLVELVYELKL